jgi:membrane fusion protein (multidrug efflux system)
MNGKAWVLAAMAIVVSGCKPETPSDAAAAPANPGARPTTAEDSTTKKTAAGGGGGGGRGRPASAITLAAADVTVIQPTTIEDVTPISGDLRPIETLAVRSRVDGVVDAVLVREGQVVRAGQLLARFESSEQESDQRSAEADRAAAQSDLANAQWNAEQSTKLFKAGAISEHDDKATQQALVSAQARLAAADARLRSMAIGVRDTRVLSPTAGVVDKREVEQGEHVTRGATMFSVVRNNVLELTAAMPARDAGAVRVGQLVRFTADGKSMTGTVARVSPTIDPVTRSVTVYVDIPNPTGAIRGGTFATGQVVSQTINNVLALPRDAVHQTQAGDQYVYRIVDKNIDVTPIKTGVTDERLGLIQIASGLEAGDRVVTGNVGVLGRGMQVNIAGNDSGRSGDRGPGATTKARSGGRSGGRGRANKP